MTTVRVNPDEPLDKALRRFKKKIEKEGLIKQIKRTEHYEKPSQKKRRKLLKIKKRLMKAKESGIYG